MFLWKESGHRHNLAQTTGKRGNSSHSTSEKVHHSATPRNESNTRMLSNNSHCSNGDRVGTSTSMDQNTNESPLSGNKNAVTITQPPNPDMAQSRRTECENVNEARTTLLKP